MSFSEIFDGDCWEVYRKRLESVSSKDVRAAISRAGRGSLDDFICLVSPEAEASLEEMAQISHRLTERRFGKTMQLFVPLYLSNECTNICTYCGFSQNNRISRLTLTPEQIAKEIEEISSQGFDHVLIVTGEARSVVGVDYLVRALKQLSPHFANISLEVQPLAVQDYERLAAARTYGVLVYQETYNSSLYKQYHTKGRKADFTYRLDTPDRLGQARMHKIGLGVLLGLADWRVDSICTAQHLIYLKQSYWRSKFQLSFPRLRPASGFAEVPFPVSEKNLVQLICAWRLLDENLELSLSTRESSALRDRAVKFGITSMSAGSSTEPGGYALKRHALNQFDIADTRSPQEVADMLRQQGLEPVWKDWDSALEGTYEQTA